MSKEATKAYREYYAQRVTAFVNAFGLTNVDMDEDSREELGKETPTEDFMAGWSAALIWQGEKQDRKR